MTDWRREDYYWQELARLVDCPSRYPQDIKDAVLRQCNADSARALRLKARAEQRVQERIDEEKTIVHRMAERLKLHGLVEVCERRAAWRYLGKVVGKGV